MTAGRLVVALLFTVAYAAVMFALKRYRVASAVFNFNWDLVDPRNYRAEGRWLILLAVLLALGTLVAWMRVIAG